MILLTYLLAVLSGVVLSFAYAPYDLGWISWFFPAALITLIWSRRHEAGKKRFWWGCRLGWGAGLGFWIPNLWWVGAVSEQAGWVSSVLLASYLSAYFAAWGAFASTLGREKPIKPKSQPAFSILYVAGINALFWCGLEWLRGLSRVSHGWDGLGVPLLESAFVIAQAADLVGVKGLSFLPVFGGAVLVQTMKSFHVDAVSGKRRIHWEVATTLLLICGTFSYGLFRLNTLYAADKEQIRALIIQRNIPLKMLRDSSADQAIYEEYATAMREAFSQIETRAQQRLEAEGEVTIQTPELVVWPESALPKPIYLDPDGELILGQDNALFFENEIRPLGTFHLITGANEYPTEFDLAGGYRTRSSGPFYNSTAFFSAGFETYEGKPKHHLMPFGEYLPFEKTRAFQSIYTFFAGQVYQGSFSTGEDFTPQRIELNRGRIFSVIPLLCYEDTVGSLARKYVRDDPQIMVNVTNDVWFAGTSCAEKHFQNARFRTIELRKPLVRAANTGVSAIVDITGSTGHPTQKRVEQVLVDEDGNVEIKGALEGVIEYPLQPIFSVYAMIGDVFCWAGGTFALFFGFLRRFTDENSGGV